MELNENIQNLIYTDTNRIDQGVIQGYEFDLAYGADENSFTLTVPRNSYFLETGSYVYIEGTEYGGIIDSLEVNSVDNLFVYSGRTWHGILASKIVRPETDADYFSINQTEGNEAINKILENVGENGTKLIKDDYVQDEYGNLILKDWVLIHYKFQPNPFGDGGEERPSQDYDTYEAGDVRLIRDGENTRYTVGDLERMFSEYDATTKRLVVDGGNGTMDYAEYTFEYIGKDAPEIVDGMSVLGVQWITHYEYDVKDDVLFYPNLNEHTEREIIEYNARYTDAYSTMLQMLYEQKYKPVIEFPCELDGEKVNACMITAKTAINYADDEEWNLRNQQFVAKKTTNRINHIIALGQGDLKNRYVLDVYADANGGIIEDSAETFLTNYERMYTGFSDGKYKIMLQYKATNDSSVIVKHMTDKKVYGLYLNVLYEAETSGNGYAFTDKNGTLHTLTIPDGIDNLILPRFYDEQYAFEKIERNNDFAEVLDYPSAEYREKYLKLIYRPFDFAYNFRNYFSYNAENDEYSEIQAEEKYDILSSSTAPQNWATTYSNYYELSNGTYSNVNADSEPIYKNVTSLPLDWNFNYGNYKIKGNRGLEDTYSNISGDTVKTQVPQKRQPSDWGTNYKDYFYYGTGYVENTSKQWKKNKYYKFANNKYTKLTEKPNEWKTDYKNYFVAKSGYYNVQPVKGKAPTWKSGKYYTEVTTTVAPNFANLAKKNVIVLEVGSTPKAPQYIANKYYTRSESAPPFAIGLYYELVTDHYASLYEQAVEKLQEYANSDEIEMNLSTDYDYDVFDIVGCYDEETKLEIAQPITKKIVQIKGNQKTVTYEIGGN